jgi:heavy metal efflux system protein
MRPSCFRTAPVSDLRGNILRASEEVGSPDPLFHADFHDRLPPNLHDAGVEGAIFSPMSAIGGQAVTQVLEGDRRFDLVVRWLPQYRQSLDAIRQIRVSTPAGASIPLSLVSDIRTAEGASFIYRVQLARYVPLHFAVRGRALESAIADAKQRVAREVRLPEGVHLEWAGEYGELSQAIRRLEFVIPFMLVLIAAVLYGATYSWIDTFIIMA